MGHLRHALPVIAVVSTLVFLLGHWGLLRGFETATLDTWLRLRAPTPVRNVVVVGITECDYRELFAETSPLNATRVGEVVAAIRAGRPKAIGIDLDTEHASFGALRVAASGPPVVWARSASAAGAQGAGCQAGATHPVPSPGAEGHATSAGGHGEGHGVLVAGGVLGGASVPEGGWAGVALLPQDPDGVIRRYQRVFQTSEGKSDSFPWALVRAAASSAIDEPPGEQLVLNFSGDRYAFPRYSAQAVLAGAKGEAWGESGPLTGKIVLLGGLYRAARDEYLTPVGPMAGVELVAQAVEADLAGGGIRGTNEALMVTLEILGGVLMVWLYFRMPLSRALPLSLIGLPLMALGFSYLSFSSVGRWASFVPTLVAVLLHQLHHHAVEYRRLYLQSLVAGGVPGLTTLPVGDGDTGGAAQGTVAPGGSEVEPRGD